MKNKLYSFCVMAALSVSTLTGYAASLPDELDRQWADTKLPSSALSVYVQELGSNRAPLLALNERESRNPASVMKLVTTYAALQKLGPAWTWQTQFLSQEMPQSGRLSQPLYLKTSGDPTISVEALWNLLQDLRLRGIKDIPKLIVDRSVYGDVNIDTFAFDGDGMRAYNASPDPWTVAQSALRINLHPNTNTKTWEVATYPSLSTIKLEGAPAWEDGDCPSAFPSVPVEAEHYEMYSTLKVSGALKSGCGDVNLYRVVLHPAVYASDLLTELWANMGGTIGAIEYGDAPASASNVLASHSSEPLAEIIRTINKDSNNLMARQLMLSLGTEMSGKGTTTESAAADVKRVLNSQGLVLPELVIENGSGLSRVARISAQGLGEVLQAGWSSSVMPEYLSSLSIAGMDGTFRRRYQNNETVKGSARLKSGTLRDVRALAGYVTSQSGRRFVVISLINHEKASAANAFNDKLVEWVIKQ